MGNDGHNAVSSCDVITYLCYLNVTLLEDLFQNFIFVCSAEFVLEGALACSVEDALGAVAGMVSKSCSKLPNWSKLTCP